MLSILAGLFFKGTSILKDFFSALFSNPKSLLIVLAFCAVGFGAYKINSSFKELNSQVAVVKQERDDAVRDAGIIKAANDENVKTIDEMKKNAALNEKSSSELHAKLDKNSQTLRMITDKLNKFTAADDGSISKALGSTISDIQDMRDQREKQ